MRAPMPIYLAANAHGRSWHEALFRRDATDVGTLGYSGLQFERTVLRPPRLILLRKIRQAPAHPQSYPRGERCVPLRSPVASRIVRASTRPAKRECAMM